MIIAVVGSGGKTSLVKRLAGEYREQGKKVLVCTTTHMELEEGIDLSDDGDIIAEKLERDGYVMAGTRERFRLCPLSQAAYERACQAADVVIVEADGSRRLSIKYPAHYEPVIYDNVERILVVTGVHGLGKPFREVAHRLELVKECLGVEDEDLVEPKHIQQLLRKGFLEPLREKYPDKKIEIHPSHTGTLYQRAVSALLAADLDVNLIKEEWFQPQPNLMVCGGGHVSVELVKLASALDFKITVMDDRPEFANQERFPWADRVICDTFEHLEQHLLPNAYYCIVTRGHQDDYQCVKTILQHKYRYLGMIGSKVKVQIMNQRLREDGVSEEQIAAIHQPIGLSIGAVTPAEIAISILAEIIQEKNRGFVANASRELLEVTESGILCVILEKKGSTPRGVGTMMFLGKDRVIDSIGGGPIEYEALQDARSCTEPMMRSYHMNMEEGAALGMICGGSNQVLFLPL